jgi:subtilase family serine protease
LLRDIAAGRAQPISRAEFERTYAPEPQSVARVTTYLESRGLRIVDSGRTTILASAPARTIERTFATGVHDVRQRVSGDWYESTQRPTLPKAIAPLLKTVVISKLAMHTVK